MRYLKMILKYFQIELQKAIERGDDNRADMLIHMIEETEKDIEKT